MKFLHGVRILDMKKRRLSVHCPSEPAADTATAATHAEPSALDAPAHKFQACDESPQCRTQGVPCFTSDSKDCEGTGCVEGLQQAVSADRFTEQVDFVCNNSRAAVAATLVGGSRSAGGTRSRTQAFAHSKAGLVGCSRASVKARNAFGVDRIKPDSRHGNDMPGGVEGCMSMAGKGRAAHRHFLNRRSAAVVSLAPDVPGREYGAGTVAFACRQ